MHMDRLGSAYYNQRMPLIALAVLLAAAAPSASAAPRPAGAPPARLLFASDGVTVESKGGRSPGKTGAALADGDAVATAAGATAVVELADGSRLKLRESSRLVLTLPAVRSPITEVLLSLGSVFAKVTKRRPGEEFHVRTQTAVAAVRGTQFFTAYGRDRNKAPDLWVCVNEGAVDVKTTASKAELLVPAGKGVLIKSGLDVTKPQAYDWTKKLNWNMDPKDGAVEDKTSLDAAYADLLDQDYH
jgi:ferric-dicitrate binding protein FerR (iron transport regulator)